MVVMMEPTWKAASRRAWRRVSYMPRMLQVMMTMEMRMMAKYQRTSSIRHADQIVVLDDGKVCGIGTHEELLETCKVYQEIYYSQYDKKEAK